MNKIRSADKVDNMKRDLEQAMSPVVRQIYAPNCPSDKGQLGVVTAIGTCDGEPWWWVDVGHYGGYALSLYHSWFEPVNQAARDMYKSEGRLTGMNERRQKGM